jgi:hypothetical protein
VQAFPKAPGVRNALTFARTFGSERRTGDVKTSARRHSSTDLSLVEWPTRYS